VKCNPLLPQARDKVKEVAAKLGSAIKTGRTLQMLEGMKQQDVAKNRVHQQNYEKQLKVLLPVSTLYGRSKIKKDYSPVTYVL